MVVSDPLKIGYENQFYREPFKNKKLGNTPSSIINFFIYFCLTPLFFLALSYSVEKLSPLSILLFIIFFSFLYSWHAVSSKISIIEDKGKSLRTSEFLKIFITYLYINLISIISLALTLVLAYSNFKIKTDTEYLTTILIFMVFGYFTLLPPQKPKPKNCIEIEKEPPSEAEKLFNSAINIPAAYTFVILVAISLYPAIVHKTTTLSFRLLGIGGNIERSYYYEIKNLSIPSELIKKCESKICITKPLKVVLDLGGLLYVKAEFLEKKEATILLPGKDLYYFNINNSTK